MADLDLVKKATSEEAEKSDDAKQKSIINAGLAMAQGEVVQRYGAAVKTHLVAHGGMDNETGEELSKSLMKLYGYKISPRNRNANTNQQAGFAAEVMTAAKEDAEKIIAGKKNAKVVRTDDMKKQSDGKGGTVGGKNDQLYDIAEVDKNGNYIEGTGRQLKYVGGTPEDCAKELLNKKWDKYRDADVPIEVPSDFYDGAKKKLEGDAKDIKKQIADAETKGKTKLAEDKKKELERVEKTSKNLRKGQYTKAQAIEMRTNPYWHMAKQIGGVAHRGGVEAAKSGAIIGGGISFIRNSVSVIQGDMKAEDAVIEVATDTAGATALSYATGFAGGAIKGAMQNAPSKYARALSKTNLPATVATMVWETGKTLKQYAEGEIDGTDCLIELGEKGTGMLSSAMFATVGQALIPIPIVGGMIGGMVGYAMSSAYYNDLVNALKGAKLAHEERLLVEEECRQAVIAIREYQLEIELVINNYLREHRQVFSEALADMEAAFITDDVDGFIKSSNRITEQLGGTPLFTTKKDFDVLMSNPGIFRL